MTIGSKQFSLSPKGFHQSRPSTHATQCLACRPTQLRKILRAKIGQLMLFAVAPDVLHRVKFRRISGQKLQLDGSALLGDKLPHQSAPMSRQAIPNDGQGTADVPLKMFQELDDLRRLDASWEKAEIEVPDGYAGDGRQAFPVERKLQHRCLATRGPSANSVRSLAQTALVHKHYGSALLERFFFSSGQRTCFHRWMAGSSRWVARPTGRWQLQPSERKIRQTCPG